MPLEQELTDALTQAIRDKDTRTADVVRMLKTRVTERRTGKGFSGAVDDAVIAGQRHRHLAFEAHTPNFGFDRTPLRRTDRKDGRLRRVDDRGEITHAIHAEVGDRADAALVVVGLQLLVARALGQRPHFVRDRAE